MKAEELRKGNYISHITGEIRVESNDIALVESDECEYFPILLTEDWINVKFKNKLFNSASFYYQITKTGHFDIYIGAIYLVTIQFVHEYQNLYRSLTGKELEVDQSHEKINSRVDLYLSATVQNKFDFESANFKIIDTELKLNLERLLSISNQASAKTELYKIQLKEYQKLLYECKQDREYIGTGVKKWDENSLRLESNLRTLISGLYFQKI